MADSAVDQFPLCVFGPGGVFRSAWPVRVKAGTTRLAASWLGRKLSALLDLISCGSQADPALAGRLVFCGDHEVVAAGKHERVINRPSRALRRQLTLAGFDTAIWTSSPLRRNMAGELDEACKRAAWPLVVVGPLALAGVTESENGTPQIRASDTQAIAGSHAHPGLSEQAWLFPDYARISRHAGRQQGHRVRTRHRTRKKRSAAPIEAQSTLFGAYGAWAGGVPR